MTLDEAAQMLAISARETTLDLNVSLIAFGEVVKEAAKEMIGHEHEHWPPLAEETIEDKERQGYDTPAPLLRQGVMRESISADVVDLTLVVGSDDKVALYQEIGTSRIPPRPFLSTAMIDHIPFIVERLQADAVKLLTGLGEK